jgi:hypothetical protein
VWFLWPLSYGNVQMSECEHDFQEWRGRTICVECGLEVT